jgi:hypothetical protein
MSQSLKSVDFQIVLRGGQGLEISNVVCSILHAALHHDEFITFHIDSLSKLNIFLNYMMCSRHHTDRSTPLE